MRLPPWFFKYIRRHPRNFTGRLIIDCQDGGVMAIETRDRVTEEIFYTRYQEERPHEPANAASSLEWTTN